MLFDTELLGLAFNMVSDRDSPPEVWSIGSDVINGELDLLYSSERHPQFDAQYFYPGPKVLSGARFRDSFPAGIVIYGLTLGDYPNRAPPEYGPRSISRRPGDTWAHELGHHRLYRLYQDFRSERAAESQKQFFERRGYIPRGLLP